MSKKMAMLLAGMLAASLIAAAYAFTMNLGMASTTVPVTPIAVTKSEPPIVHTRTITIHKPAKRNPDQSSAARTVEYPSPAGTALTGGTSAPTAPGSAGDEPRANPGDGDD